MNITNASALITAALASGTIDAATALRAQSAIRESSYYGLRMTADDRQRMLANRFGISA
jgi:hypothetical protein